MKSRRLIEERLSGEVEPTLINILKWVLETPECPLCNHSMRSEMEGKLHRDEMTYSFLETKLKWPIGIVQQHMEEHIEYDPREAYYIEQMRSESISTLNVAEDLVQRLVGWVDELEQRKTVEGLTSEWITDASKLLGQGQGFLKLVGQLKKEIGVDSQFLLADRKVESIMGVLVEVLRTEPIYLDQIELRLAALKAPTDISYSDTEFEVIE